MSAFEDSLCDIEVGEYKKCLIIFSRFDVFAKSFPSDSAEILDIIASVSRLYLTEGIKLITLVQTDERKLSFPPIGCFSISYNLRE